MNNYAALAKVNLERLYGSLPGELERMLPAQKNGLKFIFAAFGQSCAITPDGVTLDGVEPPGVIGILLSLYALNATTEVPILEPLRAFKEFPDSAPYVGAFASHTERVLVPHVEGIEAARPRLREMLAIEDAVAVAGGDFSFFVSPLPKIALCYIFYRADEEFPASATCLFSTNASRFLPMDGLADVGEYTSKKILTLL